MVQKVQDIRLKNSMAKNGFKGWVQKIFVSFWPMFFLFALIMVFFLTSAFYVGQLLMRKENQYRLHQDSATLLSNQIENELSKRLQIIWTLSKNRTVLDVVHGRTPGDSPDINLALNTANEVAHSELILVLNKDGTVISSSNNKTASLVGFNYAFRPYFQESMKGRPFIFPAVGAVTHTRGLYLSAPIYIPGHPAPAGVIALKIGINLIEGFLYNRSDKVAIVSPEGIIFSSNQKDWLYRSATEIEKKTMHRLELTRQFGSHKIQSHWLRFDSDSVEIGNKLHHVLKKGLPIAGWHIYSCYPKDILSPLPRVLNYILLSAVCVTGFMSVLIFFLAANIHNRHQTETKLRKAEEKYYSIFKNATMGIFQATVGGRFLEVSPSMAQMLGYDDPEELKNQVTNVEQQLYKRSIDRRTFVGFLLDNKIVKGFETQFVRKDGALIWVSISGRMVNADRENERFLEGFCLDITEKKEAENALIRERDIFSKLMETSPLGIVLLNGDQTVSFANLCAESLLELKKDPDNPDQYSKSELILETMNGQPLQEDKTPAAIVLSTGKTLRDVRVKIVWSDGSYKYLSLNISPIFDAEQAITQMVMIFEDISNKVRSEKEAAFRKEQLIRADRMISLGILTSGVAHEINNPNTFILGNAQFFADAWQEAQVIIEQYAKVQGDFSIGGIPYSKVRKKMPVLCSRIIEGSRRIKRIVQELKAYSGQEKTVLTENISINEIIRSAQILLANMIKKSTNRFEVELGEKIPPIKGNFQRIEQVVINIIQNACQALPDQDRKILIQTYYDKKTSSVIFNCRDEGIGIPEDRLRHITDPFYTTKRDSGGIGLGLSISSNIVSDHGGVLSFETARGSGTTVSIRIPVHDESGLANGQA